MGSARQAQRRSVSIRSPTYWSLLGLIIERPDYGYSLAQRLQREFGEALPKSSSSSVYEGLSALEGAGLIEEYASRGGRQRQPTPHYRATPDGVQAYVDWLTSRIRAERFRSRLFARQVAALEQEPMLGLRVIDEYERACLEDGKPSELDGCDSLATALPAEQARLAAQAELPWASYARRRFIKLARDRR